MNWILYPWRGKNPEWFKSQDPQQPWGFFKTHFATLHLKYDVVKGGMFVLNSLNQNESHFKDIRGIFSEKHSVTHKTLSG